MSGRVCAYIAFAYTTAVTAFLIAWLMHCRIASFAVVAVQREWDLDEKATACRNAGLMYLTLAIGLSLRSAYTHYRTRTLVLERHEEEMADARESVPLLCATLLETRGVDDSKSSGNSNNSKNSNRGRRGVSYGSSNS
ncbi:uncharacterized protein TM35_000015200 [Trypanosoma theileri]|uniref:Transmembrane protein n=1 Tax=Trypanosoma theileri TaxID=67003 RepID=A0A1X0PAJ5_9TRYP|nr:uncharacterized protein TM35_000015200 [Trypanosoma theileri]ORC93643.1 hypothetical protein TM35_000015200 [Trypanosoma theileri]